MDIQANNIVLDCQGHTIDGIDQSFSYGISVHHSFWETTNIIIKNCVVSDWNEGIHLYYAGSNILTNITVNSNYYGIYLYLSNSNTIKNSRFQDNNYGIYLIYRVGTNLIYNNLFNNTNNFYIGKAIACNWNTSYQEGENIWNASLGYIGGNAWFKPDGTGYSETNSCHDVDYNGFCDDPYVLATNNIDYLPVAKNVGQYTTPPALPAPRLYQLSPIAGILAYVLLPIVFAMVAQKYLLGEVELTLQGLIRYLLIFVMVIIIAIGFAYVFSVL
jgi:parallel beta-helix repeat protein